ncbi:ZIP family metal transporter [Thermodesulfovibrio thiophilus]|uniref:ZIP family metal transporter n=1 Tax=Thermodesulfovibrio thiophilus TaxID=340095 RepID=UPI000407AD8E|nr:ZIP family metal transporter [Thermodesulfovibrio thiophilus]HHW20187.1 ZIP family metal transporter [Thermodesulfovibrio thiophilus]
MIENLMLFSSPVQALFAGIFTWFLTAVGASMVLFVKHVNRKLLDTVLGFAAGVMIAASFWSLLEPAIEMSQKLSIPSWIPPASGFVMGAVFLRIIDMILPHLHLQSPISEAEGLKTSFRRSTLLVLAVTLHNIPEGLAVGVSFGAHGIDPGSVNLLSSVILAFGIGIQNIPEGFAISMPLRSEGFSKNKSFMFGQFSGFVEPVFAVIGALLVELMQTLLPYALGFAAGAMIFVTVEELIPESQRNGHSDFATAGLIIGFTIMMILDVAFK